MAFSKLELALGALVGLDLAAPGTTRKIAVKLVMGAASRAPAVAGGDRCDSRGTRSNRRGLRVCSPPNGPRATVVGNGRGTRTPGQIKT